MDANGELLHAAGQALLENTLRLYRDAQLLLKNERFASCLSMAVLSAEELAKFLQLVELQPLKPADWREHRAKHVATASFLLRRKFQAALRLTLGGRSEEAERARFAKLDFRHSEMNLFDEVLKHVIDDGSLMQFSRAYQRQMDTQKQRGFYVDLAPDLTIKSDPKTITRDQAREQLKFLSQALRAVSDALDDPSETA